MDNKPRIGISICAVVLLVLGSLSNVVQSASYKNKELIVWCTFIVGRIKNPYYQDNFYFQVVNVTVIGFFWKDLANPYFGLYRLNESWMVQDAQYLGINHFRIVLHQSGITHVFGILANGDILSNS